MGNTLWPEGVFKWFQSACLLIEVAEIVLHEAGEPKALVANKAADANCPRQLLVDEGSKSLPLGYEPSAAIPYSIAIYQQR